MPRGNSSSSSSNSDSGSSKSSSSSSHNDNERNQDRKELEDDIKYQFGGYTEPSRWAEDGYPEYNKH